MIYPLQGSDAQTFIDVTVHFLKITVHYDRSRDALYRGGFADVWKGEYDGREVAVKALRTYSGYRLRSLPYANSLTDHFVEVLQGSCDVEIPSTFKRPASNRSNDVRQSVFDDIRLDGEWEHQRLCSGIISSSSKVTVLSLH